VTLIRAYHPNKEVIFTLPAWEPMIKKRIALCLHQVVTLAGHPKGKEIVGPKEAHILVKISDAEKDSRTQVFKECG